MPSPKDSVDESLLLLKGPNLSTLEIWLEVVIPIFDPTVDRLDIRILGVELQKSAFTRDGGSQLDLCESDVSGNSKHKDATVLFRELVHATRVRCSLTDVFGALYVVDMAGRMTMLMREGSHCKLGFERASVGVGVGES